MTYKNLKARNFKRYAVQAAVVGSLALLAACGGTPPQTVSTTSEQTTTSPAPPAPMAPMAPPMVPGAPGTMTTTTTNSQTQSPAQ